MSKPEKIEIEDAATLREFSQMSLFDRAVRKWKQGEFFQAAWRTSVRKARQYGRKLESADFHYLLDAERVMTKRYSETFEGLKPHHVLYGNYYLDSRLPLNERSIVYSFGVGGDISFDRAVAQAFGCEVFMYDPTPESVSFIELMRLRQASDPVLNKLKFFPLGAWSEDTTLRFDVPARGGCATAVEDVGTVGAFFEAPCQSVKTMMKNNAHQRIDVLKMDIEGAAERVLDHMLEEKILPPQVVAEFERPRHDIKKVVQYFGHIDQLCTRMREAGYEITFLPRDRAKYFGIELLFARVG